ncbi:hypothetical protein Pfo_017086, partial [Paulownia fortunei]
MQLLLSCFIQLTKRWAARKCGMRIGIRSFSGASRNPKNESCEVARLGQEEQTPLQSENQLQLLRYSVACEFGPNPRVSVRRIWVQSHHIGSGRCMEGKSFTSSSCKRDWSKDITM